MASATAAPERTSPRGRSWHAARRVFGDHGTEPIASRDRHRWPRIGPGARPHLGDPPAQTRIDDGDLTHTERRYHLRHQG